MKLVLVQEGFVIVKHGTVLLAVPVGSPEQTSRAAAETSTCHTALHHTY